MESSSTDDPPPPFINFLPKTPSATSFYEMPRERRLKLLVAANGPKEVAYAQTIAVRLSKEPKITVKVVVDELTHRLAQEFPCFANRSLHPPSLSIETDYFNGAPKRDGSTAKSTGAGGHSIPNCQSNREIDCAQRRAFELVDWADLLVLAPIDADNLGRMMAGIADTLLLEVLRSWDASKRILLVPGMSTHMWENPVTKRQISKLHRKWYWVRVLPPILWHYNAPSPSGDAAGNSAVSTPESAIRTHSQQQEQQQQSKRVVQWSGFAELIGIIKNHADLLSLGHDVDIAALNGGRAFAPDSGFLSAGSKKRLPPEIWSMILEYTGDWELAAALDVFTKLPMPAHYGWRRQPSHPDDPLQVFMHELEWTLLTAQTDKICQKLSEAPATIHDLSALAIKLIFKFSLTDVLTYVEAHCPLVFRNFDGKTVPTKASAYFGKTEILDWWVRSPSFLEKQYDAEALDGASKNGYVHVLEWWRRSGLPLKYTEAALEQASAKGHVRVLEWWREASLASPPGVVLKPGRALICAAQYGRVDVIRWWEESGVNGGHQDAICKVASRWGQVEVLELWRELRGDDKMVFNHQVLVEATMHSHLAVLDWWKGYAHGTLPRMNGRRAKQVEYRTMDIEEALEDALGDPAAVRRWWATNGLNLGLGTSEWMKARYL
ncbi:uncharacterized protein SPSK_00736 [Sporothrix schenckii 1099-18]|uniref:Flavoprotein domain-containing protein n=2 Tax=Sporothrix schenckii TaxID=29908 RepID=U7PM40_SPOS1|nr:uncharacterized protein SPSK_00736 [Sporothrix schenckii 1099-18]ERS95981.1 hypothetical protein HMPREF1624_07516 [Sporothrix schenckii ATCC 58251]KJR81764.1 hypothetical protein SPSK_00736 [Sporothrix schenckii 1099-18]